MKNIVGLITTVLLVAATNPVYALSLKFENKTKWEIHELYFSPADEDEWGPDQLQDEIIEPDETFTLKKISKGDYDVKIVDEDGDSCEINDVDFNASEHFVLTNKLLIGCQAATEAENGEEEEEADELDESDD